MCPCVKAGWKVALLALAPAAVVAVLATQFLAPASGAAAPAAPEGVLLSDLRQPADKQPAPAANNAGQQLVVDMNNWTETDGSGFRRR